MNARASSADPLWLGAGALTAVGGATAALLSGTSPLGAALAASWVVTAAAVVAPAVSPAFASSTESEGAPELDVAVRRGVGWLVGGTALALPLLGAFAALLLAKTHLRPLAAATFAVVALGTLALGVLAARRVSVLAALRQPRGAVVAAGLLLLGAVVGAPLAALVLGPMVALCARRGSPRLTTLAAAGGAGLAVLLLAVDSALGLGARVSLCAHAPWLAGPLLLGG